MFGYGLIVVAIVILLLPCSEDIKFVYADVLLTLGGSLLGFLFGSKMKEKVAFSCVTIPFVIFFCALSIIQLLTYNCNVDECNCILSALTGFITAVWFSNISIEDIQ